MGFAVTQAGWLRAVSKPPLEHLRLGTQPSSATFPQGLTFCAARSAGAHRGDRSPGVCRAQTGADRCAAPWVFPPGAGKICTADKSWDLLVAVVLKYSFPRTRLFLPFSLENSRITDPKFNPNLNSLTPISFWTIYFRLFYYF